MRQLHAIKREFYAGDLICPARFHGRTGLFVAASERERVNDQADDQSADENAADEEVKIHFVFLF